MSGDFIFYTLAAVYIASSICAWAILSKDWLRSFGEVSLGDAIFFFVISIFGPASLAAALIVYAIGTLSEWKSPIIMRRKRHKNR